MTAIAAKNVDAFLAKPNPAQPVVLVYGPDAGLVAERAAALIRASVDDISDPFSLARLDGDELASEPSRLVEEANTIPLFGGRRAVWVKAGARNFAPSVDALLANAAPDCRVVIEAGELRKNAPLRVICEKAKNAVALPCYEDDEQALERLIDTEMRDAGLGIAPDARAMLVPLLGGDRLASRSEIGKLALYARGKERVEVDDVRAVVSDASALAIDELIDAAFAGKPVDVEFLFGKARNAGTSIGTILFTAQRHVSALHKARLAIETGQPIGGAVEGMWLNYGRKKLAETALRAWTAARLARAMGQLADAVLDSRKQSALADVIAQRALLQLAMTARRRD